MTGCDAIFLVMDFYQKIKNLENSVNFTILNLLVFMEVMEKMADKSKAKEEMVKAGVPVVPGSKGAVRTLDEGKKIAREIGYPIMGKSICWW